MMDGKYVFSGKSVYSLENKIFTGEIDIGGKYIHGRIEHSGIGGSEFKGVLIDKYGLLVMMLVEWPIKDSENQVYYLEKDDKLRKGFATPIEGKYSGFFYPDMVFHPEKADIRDVLLEKLLLKSYEADFRKTLNLVVDLKRMHAYDHQRPSSMGRR